jgi:hypothetical protein
LNILEGFTEAELEYLYSPNRKSRAARARWSSMSKEDKDAYLKRSFLSEEAKVKSKKATRQIWADKTPEQIKEHVSASFLSPEAKRKSKDGYRKFIAELAGEERLEFFEHKRQGIVEFWKSPGGEEAIKVLRRKGSEAWLNKSPKEKEEWLRSSFHSESSREKVRDYWETMSEEARRAFGESVFSSKKNRGTLADGKSINMEEFLLGFHLESLYPGVFSYNGSGHGVKVIGRKIPDFISKNGERIVVELFGRYWHGLNEEGPIIEYYKGFGYRCIVIWDFDNILSVVKEKLGSVMKSELPDIKYIGIRSATEGGG